MNPHGAPHVGDGPVLRTLRGVNWMLVVTASYFVFNLIVLPSSIRLGPHVGQDWDLWTRIPAALEAGTLYDIHDGMWFAWSPVVAPVMVGVTMLGYWFWVGVHMASVWLLKDPLLIAMVLVSYSFWVDVAQGNTFTFAFMAGMVALRGNRFGAFSYFLLCLLIPRPIQLPLAVWLLLRDRTLLPPFLMLFAAHALAVVASGYAYEWVTALGRTATVPWDMGPTSVFGPGWLLIGIPLAVLLTMRGHVGWAGLAVSPYLIPQYLLWPLMELRTRRYADDTPTRTTGP